MIFSEIDHSVGGATLVLLKVLLFIKVVVATLKTLPRPILFLFQIALYQGFPMMYHLFHNSMWKVVRIAKTSDCKISWRVFLQGTVGGNINTKMKALVRCLKMPGQTSEVQWRPFENQQSFTVRRFGYSNHLPHRIMKQMIHHWKTLIQGFLKRK